jgi:hypothetical protein
MAQAVSLKRTRYSQTSTAGRSMTVSHWKKRRALSSNARATGSTAALRRQGAPPEQPVVAPASLARSVTARSTETLAQMPPLVMLPPRPPG